MTKPTGNPRGRPTKARSAGTAIARNDGWSNVLTNINNARDPITAARVKPFVQFDKKTLSSMYRSDGLARRVVDVLVEDATREWIEADPLLTDALASIRAKQETTDAMKWARLYGGSLVVAMVDDGQDFTAPLKLASVRRLVQLRTYDRHRVYWSSADLDMDPMSRNFGRPMFYNVQPMTGAPYKVHYTRTWRLEGLSIPDEERQSNNGWTDSALAPAIEAIRNYAQTMGASANIVRDFVQVVLGIKGLTDMMRQGEDKLVAARANVIDMTRSVANAVFLDADGETYDKKASSVAGLADLWDRFALHVSSVTGIPATKLMGRSPAGMNATGESDIRQWYDVVREYQTDEVKPLLSWIIGILGAQSEWDDRPENMDWAFPSLYQPTEVEWADVKLKVAQADAIYLDRGAADPEYLYHLRFGQGEYRPDASYDFDAASEWMAKREAMEPDNDDDDAEQELVTGGDGADAGQEGDDEETTPA